jgi:hypothetical protein
VPSAGSHGDESRYRDGDSIWRFDAEDLGQEWDNQRTGKDDLCGEDCTTSRTAQTQLSV